MGVFVFLLSCVNSICMLAVYPWSGTYFVNFFLKSVAWSVCFYLVSFKKKSVSFWWTLIHTTFVYSFLFMFSKKSLPKSRPQRFFPIFSGNSIALGSTFRSVTYLMLIFINKGYRLGLFFYIWISKCFGTICKKKKKKDYFFLIELPSNLIKLFLKKWLLLCRSISERPILF